jgi:2-phosphoglycolate phosphatase
VSSVERFHNAPPGCVLFDLDGTLVDTAPDFSAVLRTMTDELGLAPVREERVLQTVSNGARALVQMAFDLAPEHARFQPLLDRLLILYAAQIPQTRAQLYPGMDVLLRYLESNGIAWGVVTNKAVKFSAPLLAALQLDTRCAALICPDHVTRTKPDPEPLLLACKRIGCRPESGIYVGDHVRDITAGRAAGMYTIAAAYGYIAPDDPVTAWGADMIIADADTLTHWLRQQSPAS